MTKQKSLNQIIIVRPDRINAKLKSIVEVDEFLLEFVSTLTKPVKTYQGRGFRGKVTVFQ